MSGRAGHAGVRLSADDSVRVFVAAMAEAGFPGAEAKWEPVGDYEKFYWRHPNHHREDVRRAAYRASFLAGTRGERSKCWPCFRDGEPRCGHEAEWA